MTDRRWHAGKMFGRRDQRLTYDHGEDDKKQLMTSHAQENGKLRI